MRKVFKPSSRIIFWFIYVAYWIPTLIFSAKPTNTSIKLLYVLLGILLTITYYLIRENRIINLFKGKKFRQILKLNKIDFVLILISSIVFL
jgi:hypothetical protein